MVATWLWLRLPDFLFFVFGPLFYFLSFRFYLVDLLGLI